MVVLIAGLVACEPQRAPVSGGVTPLPPTPTPVLETPLRYGLGASLVPFALDTVDIRQLALVDQLTTEIADGYDLLVSFEPQTNWQVAPTPFTLALIINPNLPPLDNADVRSLVAASVVSSEVVTNTMWQPVETSNQTIQEIRASLLQNGFPDGIKLTLAYTIEVGVAALEAQFEQRNIEIQVLPVTSDQLPNLFERQQAHVLWVAYLGDEGQAQWAETVGEANIVPVAQVPLYYQAAAGIEVVGYTDAGLPLIARP